MSGVPHRLHIMKTTRLPTIQTILYATDLSENSIHALSYAVSIAQSYKAKLSVLYVVPDVWEELAQQAGLDLPGYDGLTEWQGLSDEQRQEAEQSLKRRITEFCESVEDCPVEPSDVLVESGRAAAVILKTIDEGRYSMAVLGSRGQDRITDLLLGSVASEVVRKSPIPVLLVPLDEDDF
ncbi:hypothetical protein DPQ33_07410 [Oceanidesulfovibrio indonesiensis]|uniref:UspA domain-containing protein n=2 Tax=Oceanidesulfovibrio indonesiensis TaxID=54767 RepID=A0A7M3MGA9_9BACT|nr:hypothetical protein DPQ33_07410 [Oceanidesulfovibrio indonesiensis]